MLLIAALSTVLGCGATRLSPVARLAELPWGQAPADEGIRLEYTLDAGRLGEPMAVALVDGHLVSYGEVDSPAVPDQSLGTLTLEFPHPAGRTDVALATVIVERRPDRSARRTTEGHPLITWATNLGHFWNKGAGEPDVYEQWQLAVPRDEVQRLMAALEAEGALADQSSPRPAARLAVRHDQQTWHNEGPNRPPLDHMMRQVRAYGQLVDYRQPAESLALRHGPAATVVAWQTSLRGERTTDGAAHYTAASGLSAPIATPGLHAPPGLMTRLPTTAAR